MNIKELKEMVKMLDGTDIVEFTYENEGTKIAIKKGYDHGQHMMPQVVSSIPMAGLAAMQVQTNAVAAATPPVLEDKNGGLGANQVLIVAPMVGTFYRSPSPDSDPFIQVGQNVSVGQVVCIIEAMKLMNEIESEYQGKVVDILVQNAQPVEYGQPLFVLEKS